MDLWVSVKPEKGNTEVNQQSEKCPAILGCWGVNPLPLVQLSPVCL